MAAAIFERASVEIEGIFQTEHFWRWTPEAAIDFSLAMFGMTPTPNQLIKCRTECQSAHPPGIVRAAPLGWPQGAGAAVAAIPPAPGAAAAAVVPPCLNLAEWRDNPATGTAEPSTCKEHKDIPPGIPPAHHRPHPQGAKLSCLPCKRARYQDRIWRQDAIQIGVCNLCRTWVLNNMDAGESQCTCPPVGNNQHNWNNNEPRIEHMCRSHDQLFWRDITREATGGIMRRRLLIRNYPRKKRGHGWTRTKGRLPVMSPTERSEYVRVDDPPPATVLQAQPRCFCGEKLTAADHARQPLAVAPFPRWTSQVRNCAACDGFVRNW